MLQKTTGGAVDDNMSNLTSAAISNEASISSTNTNNNHHLNHHEMAANSSILYPPHQDNNNIIINQPQQQQQQQQTKKRRNLPGNPDPESEVVALSPGSLMATNRFVCEICNKGFQRDQNLQLHRRGHNLPWKLKQRNKLEIVKRKVYVCPETSCVHHDPSRALGDLTGIKKHFSRKHGDKKWKCDKCSKRYAVQSDWKAHSKICGTREYRCDCGTLFSRRDSFITHRAFCDALAQESSRSITTQNQNQLFMSAAATTPNHNNNHNHLSFTNNNNNFHNPTLLIPSSHLKQENGGGQNLLTLPPWLSSSDNINNNNNQALMFNNSSSSSQRVQRSIHQQDQPNPNNNISTSSTSPSSLMSATALLQKAAQMGVTMSTSATKMAYQLPSSPSNHHHHHMGNNNNNTTAGNLLLPSSREVNNNNNNNENDMFVHGLASFGSKGGGGQGMNMVSSSLPSMTTAFEDSFNEMLNPVVAVNNNNNSKSRMMMSLGGGGFHQDNNNNNNNNLMMGVRKNGDEGLTRDFLGLRAFPVDHRDFMMGGLHDQMAGSGSYQQPAPQNQGPWQSR